MKKNMMNRVLLALFLTVPFGMLSQVVYDVCPNGILSNSLKGAIEDIKDRTKASFNQDYLVYLEDGIYFLDDPLIIGENISSSNNSITFKAREGEHPMISGGEKVQSWELDEKCINGRNLLKTSVNNDVRNLWINNVRMKRSQGFIGYATKIFDESVEGKNLKGLLFPKENFPAFEDISGLEIQYYQNWRNYFFKVTDILDNSSLSIIPENQVLVVIKDFEVALEVTPKMIFVGSSIPYYFENAIEMLDEPGEWCYSPQNKALYYYAEENETPENLNAFIPKLQSLISIKTSKNCNSTQNIIFSGLEFSHTNWMRPSEKGFFPKQSSTYCPDSDSRDIIPSAIIVEDANHIKFESCKFSQLGTNGIHIKNNTDSINVENCKFSDISGSAISISDCNHRKYSDSIQAVKNTHIKNNHIEKTGEEYCSCAGIEAYYCEDLTIDNNELYNMPYTGISVGWGWTMEPTTQNNVKILNNKIVGDTQKCSDGGAIYSLSHFGGDGLLIEGNYIDEVANKPCTLTQGAIYTDEGSSNVTINNNVVLTERKWFYYNWAGNVDLDSIYVLKEYTEKFGGNSAPTGGTNINFIENGAHIFSLPTDLADIIIKNAGIQEKLSNIPSSIDLPCKNEENDVELRLTSEGLTIVPKNQIDSNGMIINIYDISGSLIKSYSLDERIPINIHGISKGFHIVEIKSRNQRKAIPLIL